MPSQWWNPRDESTAKQQHLPKWAPFFLTSRQKLTFPRIRNIFFQPDLLHWSWIVIIESPIKTKLYGVNQGVQYVSFCLKGMLPCIKYGWEHIQSANWASCGWKITFYSRIMLSLRANLNQNNLGRLSKYGSLTAMQPTLLVCNEAGC